MYQQLLLEKKNLKKIEIYQKLLQLTPGTYNLLWLSNLFPYSYSQVTTLVKELDDDIRALTCDTQGILSKGQKITLSTDLPLSEYVISYLIQNDLPYQFMIELVSEDYRDLDQFAQAIYSSSSTIRRSLKPLQQYFQSYRLRLKFSTMELKGDERLIRILLTSLFWLSSHGGQLPFEALAKEEVAAVQDRFLQLHRKKQPAEGSAGRLFYNLEANLTFQRIKNGHFVKDDPHYDLLFADQTLLEPEIWGALVQAPAEHRRTETRYMTFRQLLGQAFLDESDPFITFSNAALKEKIPDFAAILQAFSRFFAEELALETAPVANLSCARILKGNIVSLLFNYYLFQTKIPIFFLLTEANNLTTNRIYNSLYAKVEKLLLTLADDLALTWIENCLSDMCRMITAITLPEYELAASEFHLTVAVVSEGEFIYSNKLINFLQTLPYVQQRHFDPHSISDFDVVISTSCFIKQTFEELPLIVFPYTTDEQAFLELNIRLKDLYLKKSHNG